MDIPKNHPPRHGGRHVLRLGIRQKVVLILLTTLLVTLSVSGWLTLRAHQQEVIDETNRRGTELAHFVARNLAYSVVAYDYHAIELLLQELVAHEDIVYARVLSAKGNPMAEAGASRAGDDRLVLFREDIRLRGETVGTLFLGISTVRIVRALDEYQLRWVQREITVILIIAVIEFLALSYIIIRPITLISRTLGESADRGGAIPAMEIRANDELGRMANEFNRLNARLTEANSRLEARVMHANEELTRANAELERLTITDPLTGLHNRRYFEQLMEQEVAMAIRHAETSSIILADIDGFKPINDRYGHDIGDAVIREVGRVVHGRLRRTDAVCRIGGDEFFVLCRHTDARQVVQLAEELRVAVARQPFTIGDQVLSITVSLGAATIPGDLRTDGADEFFKCADRALYHSKQQGRNRVTHCSILKDNQPPSN